MKIIKRKITGLLLTLVIAFLILATPRIWSALNPGKPPVGYFYILPVYLAGSLGLEKMIEKEPAVPAGIEVFKDIEYKNINGKSLQLNIYRSATCVKPAPLLVFIHGGAWNHGERSDYLVYLLAFAKKGYVTASISYRFIKDGPYPACVEDVTDAVQWFFRNGENYGYDPDRIALIGGSAGGHLALLGAYEWKNSSQTPDSMVHSTRRIKAVVDFYGPVDLTTPYARTQSLVTRFMARPFSEAPELYREASPIAWLDKDDPPTMILQGTSDNLVPVSQSDLLKGRLDSLGIPNVYCRVPGWPHTMDIIERVNRYSEEEMTLFFNKYLNHVQL